MNTFKWLLKREFWEHKGGFFWAPIVIGAIIVSITAVSLVFAVTGLRGGMEINGVPVSNLAQIVAPDQKAKFASLLFSMYKGLLVPFTVTLAACIFFFCAGALYDERKDRSVLFWKSLPVSDSATVLSKVAIAIGIAPLIALVIGTITAILAELLTMIAAAIAGVNIFGEVLSDPNTYLVPLQMLAMLPIYALWALPTIGWVLMISSWARAKPFLWAIGVPLMAGFLVSWAGKMFRIEGDLGWFWQNIIGRMLTSVVPGSWLIQQGHSLPTEETLRASSAVGEMLAQSLQLLAAPNIWIGAIAGSAMIYAAIRLRRWRDEG
ncbi:MAG: hypothetical protein ABI583_05945 [Betaproteobacteria bacterium]